MLPDNLYDSILDNDEMCVVFDTDCAMFISELVYRKSIYDLVDN